MIYKIWGKVAPVAVVAAALMLGQSAPAGASLINDTITVESEFGFPVTTTSDTNVLVGAGVEFTSGDGTDLGTNFLFPGDSVNVNADSIDITFADFTGFPPFPFIMTFSDLHWVGFPLAKGLQNVTIEDLSNVLVVGAQANVLSPSSFQFQGTVNPTGGTFSLNLEVDHTPVPLPGAAWMFLSAIGALGAAGAHRRRRNRDKTAA